MATGMGGQILKFFQVQSMMLRKKYSNYYVKSKINQFASLLVEEQESKFQKSTLQLYTSPRVTSPELHLMCLAPSQHGREGLLTQSSPLLRDHSKWSESSDNRRKTKNQIVKRKV